MSTHTNEMKAFRLIREGMDDETIRIQTGYSKAVIQAMRKDVERIDRHRKERQSRESAGGIRRRRRYADAAKP